MEKKDDIWKEILDKLIDAGSLLLKTGKNHLIDHPETVEKIKNDAEKIWPEFSKKIEEIGQDIRKFFENLGQ